MILWPVVHAKDLRFIEDGNQDYLAGDKINYWKLAKWGG